MAEFELDKTEAPTPHRRQQARRQGRRAQSQDLSAALVLLAGIGALALFGRSVHNTLGMLIERQLGGEAWLATDALAVAAQLRHLAAAVATGLLPLVATALAAAVLANVAQGGLFFLPERLAPDLGRIDPIKGLARLVSPAGLFNASFGLVKLALIGAVACACLAHEWPRINGLAELDVPQIAVYLAELIVATGLKIGLAILLLALADYAVRWWRHERDLRMTTQEVREEMKSLEGNRSWLARRRTTARKQAGGFSAVAVQGATVVIADGEQAAIAIQYLPDSMATPLVVAKGSNAWARQMRELAARHAVAVVEQPVLARTLHHEVDLGRPITPPTYAGVAEILARLPAAHAGG